MVVVLAVVKLKDFAVGLVIILVLETVEMLYLLQLLLGVGLVCWKVLIVMVGSGR